MRGFYTGAQSLGLREALGTVFQRGFRGVADLLKQVRFQIKIQFAGFSVDRCSWLCRLTGAEQCCPLQAERHPPVARPRAAPLHPPTPTTTHHHPPPPLSTQPAGPWGSAASPGFPLLDRLCVNDGVALIHVVFLCTASSAKWDRSDFPLGLFGSSPGISSEGRRLLSRISTKAWDGRLSTGKPPAAPLTTAPTPWPLSSTEQPRLRRLPSALVPPVHSGRFLPLVFASGGVWKTTTLKQNCTLIFLTATSQVLVSPLKTSKGLPPSKEGL